MAKATPHVIVVGAGIVGRFAAQEILEARRDPLLAPYGLERFLGV
jgi:glycine/D-amino acid oxidase-like deaminating enzyme